MLNIKTIRKSKGLSIAKLSEISGVPRRTIEDLEARGDCKISTAAKIAKALNTSMDDFWTEDQ